ncbi:hypothetical protein SLE2022_124910 [Rubroshorea leprosula]
MGKKKKLLPFLSQKPSSSWSWPSCQQPRTLSFRANDSIIKTVNTANVDPETGTPDSIFSNSSESPSFSTAASDDETVAMGGDSVENVIRGLRSERLFFEPGETSSILEEAKASSALPLKQSTLFLSMESIDPFMDFRKSMEEMVEAHGLKDWDGLEELLCWYLRVNAKGNHGYIFGAFVDLLVGIAISSAFASSTLSCSCSHSPSSPLSFYTSSSSSSEDSSTTRCVSSLEAEEIDNVHCLSTLLEGEEIRGDEDGV